MTAILTSDDPREILAQIISDLRRNADNFVGRSDPTYSLSASIAATALRNFADGLEFPHTMTRAEYEAAEKARAEMLHRMAERRRAEKGEAV